MNAVTRGANTPEATRLAPVPRRSSCSADPSWQGLYRTGGVAAFLYVLLGVVLPGVLFLPVGYQRGMSGDELLRFVADNRSWWVIVQTLSLGAPFVAIVVFAAIFVALKDVNKSY